MNSGIKIDGTFLHVPFFYLKKWKWLSGWFWGYQNFCPIPLKSDFKIFTQFLKFKKLIMLDIFVYKTKGIYSISSQPTQFSPQLNPFFGQFFGRNFFKMFQIQRRICWEHPRNFRILPTYGFAHAKVKISIFVLKILEFITNCS